MAAGEEIRSFLKKVFWSPAFFGGIGRSVQILEILEYSSGLNLAAALILNQNPFFEIPSIEVVIRPYFSVALFLI